MQLFYLVHCILSDFLNIDVLENVNMLFAEFIKHHDRNNTHRRTHTHIQYSVSDGVGERKEAREVINP